MGILGCHGESPRQLLLCPDQLMCVSVQINVLGRESAHPRDSQGASDATLIKLYVDEILRKKVFLQM